jgi:threonine dehydrogenase-like Zn-dependent dehydrogenase
MTARRLTAVMALPFLMVACAPTEDLGSSRGIAYRIAEDNDALEEAMNRAEDHCDDHDRTAVLQSVSDTGGDEMLATFDCAGGPGSGIALWVDEDRDDGVILGANDDDDLDDALDRANDYCNDYGRIAVLQSVSEVDDDQIAAFNCADS